ncbi:dihydropteroate synthase [Spelaeicoccus albus]|uniref:Dihydropteroate synthase n=1 Tax=Spelaeicoccus albus TaxID=1280376 RepID=A0A7Z0D5U6_9MICO|nr:dihydropteroate synthase [Spelaeicoccus albus]NYI69432.1 dihydropteroate synthase [Spelaeicoccus albus]
MKSAERTRIMGVVNVTPDSFSDGGKYFKQGDAVRHGLDLLGEGADILDVGGESTRPGAVRVDEDEELRRVIPVVRALAAEGAPISVDTMRVSVAERALDAGATILNDVSGTRAEPEMALLAARSGARLIVMHWREHSVSMQNAAHYDEVRADVVRELSEQLAIVRHAGVPAENIIVDPGLGFSKTGEHNWELLAGLARIQSLGYPVLVAASRKRFLSTMLAAADLDRNARTDAGQADGRDDATAAISALSAASGAWAVRVHAVRASRIAVEVCAEWNARRTAGEV